MTVYGNKEEFAIEVIYLDELDAPDVDFIKNPILWQRYGAMKFWVKGKNIFKFDEEDPEATYSFHLEAMMLAFASQLVHYLNPDPFPTKTKSIIGVEMQDEMCLVKDEPDNLSKWALVDWDKVDMDAEKILGEWESRHNLLSLRDASLFPHVCILRYEDTIQISWQPNTHRTDGGMVTYYYADGCEYVDIALFKKSIVSCVNAFINRCKTHYPELVTPMIHGLKLAEAAQR